MNATQLIITQLYTASWEEIDFLIVHCSGCFLLTSLLVSFYRKHRESPTVYVNLESEYHTFLGFCEHPKRRSKKLCLHNFTTVSMLTVRIMKRTNSENES